MNSSTITYCKLLVWMLYFSVSVMAMPPVESITKGKPIEDDRFIDSLQKQLSFPLNDSLRLITLTFLAERQAFKKPVIALTYAREALEMIGSNKYRIKITNLMTLGIIHVQISDYQSAISYFRQTSELCKELDDSRIVPALGNTGACYLYLKQYKMAEKYFREALNLKLKFLVKLKLDVRVTSSDYNNLGVVLSKQDKMNEAIIYFKKALMLGDKTSLPNIGEAYEELGKLDLAEYYLKKTLQFTHNDIGVVVGTYTSLGKLYTKQQRYKEAEVCLFKAKELSETSGVKNTLDEIYEQIALMYEKERKFEKVSEYRKKLLLFNDSVYEEKIGLQAVVMDAKYELNKKDNEIQLLNQKQQVAEAKSDRRTMFIFSFILVLIISAVLVRNIILKQRIRNKMLHEQYVLIELEKKQVEHNNVKLLHENTEAHYKILKSQINPHFLFNSLTTLASLISTDQVAASRFVSRFSKIYRMILETGNMERVKLEVEMNIVNNYLYLQKMRFKEGLSVYIAPDLPYHLFVPPFSVQMTVENAIKHNIFSEEEILTISIDAKDDFLVISNNLRRKSIRPGSTRTGQKNITERYRIISGIMPEFIENDHEYIVRLPLLKHVQRIAEIAPA